MSKEAMNLALEALKFGRFNQNITNVREKAIKALEEALAKQEQGEPVAFEEWLSKQHGDPEEIGFLQALRIAYISGQDSITTPQQRTAERKPLTDECCTWKNYDDFNMPDTWEADCGAMWTFTEGGPKDNDMKFCPNCGKPTIESAHGIKE